MFHNWRTKIIICCRRLLLHANQSLTMVCMCTCVTEKCCWWTVNSHHHIISATATITPITPTTTTTTSNYGWKSENFCYVVVMIWNLNKKWAWKSKSQVFIGIWVTLEKKTSPVTSQDNFSNPREISLFMR